MQVKVKNINRFIIEMFLTLQKKYLKDSSEKKQKTIANFDINAFFVAFVDLQK